MKDRWKPGTGPAAEKSLSVGITSICRRRSTPAVDHEESIVGVREDRMIRSNFGRDIVKDFVPPERMSSSIT